MVIYLMRWLVAATSKAATKIVRQIMEFIETLPRIKWTFRKSRTDLEAERCKQKTSGQDLPGKRTRIAWNESDVISLPVIEGSPASAAGLACVGLNGAIRGETKAVQMVHHSTGMRFRR